MSESEEPSFLSSNGSICDRYRDQIVDLYVTQQLPYKYVANKLNINQYTLMNWLKAQRLWQKRIPTKTPEPEIDLKRFLYLWKVMKMTPMDLSRYFHCSAAIVRKLMDENRTNEPTKKQFKYDDAAIRKMANDGCDMSEIASALGYELVKLYKYMSKHSIPRYASAETRERLQAYHRAEYHKWKAKKNGKEIDFGDDDIFYNWRFGRHCLSGDYVPPCRE